MRALGFLTLLLLHEAAAAAEPAMIREPGQFTVQAQRSIERRVIVPVEPGLVVMRPKPCCTGYVGSAYGLGKPNYYGISPRPDDGFSDVLR